nr:GDSL esterase/lipase At5g45910-like isoform X2 [Lolium perenne]
MTHANMDHGLTLAIEGPQSQWRAEHASTTRLPYGETYVDKPTGGCSDGRIIMDNLAQEFGMPLGDRSGLSHGANFPIIGATSLDKPYFEARGLDTVVRNSSALMTHIQWSCNLKPFFCNSTRGECQKLQVCFFLKGYVRASLIETHPTFADM